MIVTPVEAPARQDCPSCGRPLPSEKAVRLDPGARLVLHGGASFVLPPTEFEIVALLHRWAPRFVSIDRIIIHLYQDDEPDYADSALKVAICKLRKRLKGSGLSIETRYGCGYRLRCEKPVTESKRYDR